MWAAGKRQPERPRIEAEAIAVVKLCEKAKT